MMGRCKHAEMEMKEKRMKEKRNLPEPVDSTPAETKRKCEEPRNKDFSANLKFDLEALEKAALEKHEVYLEKMALGEALYKILDKGVVTEESFPIDWKDALDSYMENLQTVTENEE